MEQSFRWHESRKPSITPVGWEEGSYGIGLFCEFYLLPLDTIHSETPPLPSHTLGPPGQSLECRKGRATQAALPMWLIPEVSQMCFIAHLRHRHPAHRQLCRLRKKLGFCHTSSTSPLAHRIWRKERK